MASHSDSGNSRHFLGAAGTIHEDLDAAEFSAHRLQEPLDAGVVNDITSLLQRSPPERDNFRDCVSNLFCPATRRHDIRSGLGEAPSEGEPDAAGSADHHRRFIFEIEKRVTHEVLLRFFCR